MNVWIQAHGLALLYPTAITADISYVNMQWHTVLTCNILFRNENPFITHPRNRRPDSRQQTVCSLLSQNYPWNRSQRKRSSCSRNSPKCSLDLRVSCPHTFLAAAAAAAGAFLCLLLTPRASAKAFFWFKDRNIFATKSLPCILHNVAHCSSDVNTGRRRDVHSNIGACMT